MRRPIALAFALLTVLLAACGGATPSTSGTAATSTPRPTRGGANVILLSEIETAGEDMNSAYDLIERLRPIMLRPRNLSAGAGGTYGIVAYVGDIRLGELDMLKTVMRATIQEIRYINATDATTRWGTGHSNGVIQVILKR